jgi:hypothetical protein
LYRGAKLGLMVLKPVGKGISGHKKETNKIMEKTVRE